MIFLSCIVRYILKLTQLYFRPCDSIFKAFQNAAGFTNLVHCTINLLPLRYLPNSHDTFSKDMQLVYRATVHEWEDACQRNGVNGLDYILSLV